MKRYWEIPWVITWTQYLLDNYARYCDQELLPRMGPPQEQAERLFTSPFVVVSHGIQADPILNFGNQMALDLWELNWGEFTRTPSRLTAEPVNRAERARMLERVSAQGYIRDYRGVRISRTGNRFWVEQATVWSVRQSDGTLRGQAATFSTWKPLPPSDSPGLILHRHTR